MAKLDEPVISNESGSLDTGAFYSDNTILSISDESNYTTVGKKDIHLKIEVIKEGQDEPRNVHVFGRFKRDANKNIIGWDNRNNGVMFLLTTLFGSISSVDINDDWSIPESVLTGMVDKKFGSVSYVNGTYNEKPSYSTWVIFFQYNTAHDEVYKIWSENKPYNYKPNIYEEYQAVKKYQSKTDEYETKTNSSELLPF